MIQQYLDMPELRPKFEGSVPSGQVADPSDVTGAVVWLACPAESRYVNGTTLAVDASFHVN